MTRDAHSRPSSAQIEPLYDVDIPTPTHAERARTLVAQCRTATLCTVGHEPAGYPYGSFVTFAMAGASPVFLISELAEHTKNLRLDTRCSLLVAESGGSDPLANGRVTILGRCEPVSDGDGPEREAYLAANPSAAYYVDFKDFHVWRMSVEAIRYIGGYGRMSWVEAGHWSDCTSDPIAPHAAGIVTHMNADHSEALALYCRAFSKATDVSEVTMTGVDRYGFEMSAVTADGPRPIRLAFDHEITDTKQARKALVDLVQKARQALGSSD